MQLQCHQTRELSLFFWPAFGQVIFVQFFPHLVSLVSHKQCEVLLLLLLSKKLHMKRAGVVEKLSRSHRQGAFPPYHNELFSH